MSRRYGNAPGTGGQEKAHTNLREANLFGINLEGAFLQRADLSGANLRYVNLQGANLLGANLHNAYLWDRDLRGAVLRETNLAGADLGEARLENTDLRLARMDAATVLHDCSLDAATKVADVAWKGALLARLNLTNAHTLGDEANVRVATNRAEKLVAYQSAARAYRELATTLWAQGLVEEASRYRQREQRMQRKARLADGKLTQWLFSGLFNVVAGYGEKPGRAVLVYLLVILGFADLYLPIAGAMNHPVSYWAALIFSVTSFHGRGFFPGNLPTLDNWLTALAAAEAILGLFIELVFIATFSRRFLGN